MRLKASLDDVSERWLGWSFPPPQRLIDEHGWQPDDDDAYCRRCGDSVGPGEASPDEGCATCRRGAELSGGIADGVVRLGAYTDPLRDWIQSFKFRGWIEMGETLGAKLGQRIVDSGMIDPKRAVVIHVPSPWQRRMYRGVDHASVLAAQVARSLRAPMVNAMSRSMRTPQVKLSASERKRGGSRGIRVRWRMTWWNTIEGAHVVLVDDVRTTGSTLKAATRLLRRLGPERVICAVAGVSDNAARRTRGQQDRVHTEV